MSTVDHKLSSTFLRIAQKQVRCIKNKKGPYEKWGIAISFSRKINLFKFQIKSRLLKVYNFSLEDIWAWGKVLSHSKSILTCTIKCQKDFWGERKYSQQQFLCLSLALFLSVFASHDMHFLPFNCIFSISYNSCYFHKIINNIIKTRT